MYGVDFSCNILQKNTVKIRFSCHRKKCIVLLFKVHHLVRLITESAVKSIFIGEKVETSCKVIITPVF